MACCLALNGCGGGNGGESLVGRVDITSNTAEIKGAYDEPLQFELTVKNTGPVALTGLTPRASSSLTEMSVNGCAGIVLQVNATCSLVYTVRPTAAGEGTLGVDVQFVDAGQARQASASVRYVFTASQWDTAPAWAGQSGNASHTGYMPVSLRAADFKLAWTASPTPPSGGLILYGITSDNGRIYATAMPAKLSGFPPSAVYAVSAQDGSLAWQRDFVETNGTSGRETPFVGGPAIIEGELFVTMSMALRNKLFRIDASTGDTKSEYRAGESRLASFYNPVVEGGTFFIYEHDNYPGILIFDPHDPEQVDEFHVPSSWSKNVPGGTGNQIAADSRYIYLYVGSFYGDTSRHPALLVIDRATNQPAFKIPDVVRNNPPEENAPVLDEGSAHAFLSIDGSLVCFDLSQRLVAWEAKGYAGPPAYAERTVFVTDKDRLTLSALDATTGSVLWSWTAPEQIISNIVVTKTHVFVAGAAATYAISRASHLQEWTHADGGASLMIHSKGKLVIAKNSGELTGISLR